MEILTLGSELLRGKTEPVNRIDKETERLAKDMLDLMHQGKGVGLAGPQVGIMKRIFVIHVEGDIARVFINPSIIETSPEQVKMEEGCLSLPGLWADVVRSSVIKVQAWNEKGRRFILETGGVMARIIQHEYDHLEGILFIDRISEFKRNRILAKFQKKYGKTSRVNEEIIQ